MEKINNLTLVKKLPGRYWSVQCDCGRPAFKTRKDDYLKGKIKTCGCRIAWHPQVGFKVGKLTVIDNNYLLTMNWKSPRPAALCKCDCGIEFMAPIYRLYTKQTYRCASCSHKLGDTRETMIRIIYSRYKRQATERGYEFSLKREEFETLIFSNCLYSGHEPKQTTKYQKHTLLYNGIDRVDNTRGYTVDNSVSCCGICNRAKSGMTHKAWTEWLADFRSGVVDSPT